MVLILSEHDVRQVYAGMLEMEDAIRTIVMMYHELAEGRAFLPANLRVEHPPDGGCLQVMRIDASTLLASDAWALRLIGGSPGWQGPQPKERQVYLLWGLSDMSLRSVMACEWANVMRTGAATGVATDLLAPKDARVAGVIGSSKHARGQLMAVCAVRPISLVRVYSPTPEHRESFAMEMSELLGIEVVAVKAAADALADADVVCGATARTKTVAIEGRWIKKGAHVNSIGLWREVDAALVARSRLVVSHSEGVFRPTPPSEPYASMLSEGSLLENDAVELADLVLGKKEVRNDLNDVTLFASAGTPLWDVAIAARIYTLARERGVGQNIALV